MIIPSGAVCHPRFYYTPQIRISYHHFVDLCTVVLVEGDKAGDGSLPAVAESFAEQLRSLGFNVNVTSYDPTQDFISSVIRPRAYDILIYEIDLGADADLFAYYHSSQSGQNGYNLSNYNNPLVDDLILAARETVDPSLRTAKYESFLRYWVADIPAIGLYQSNLSYFYNKNSRTFSTDSILVVPTDRFSEVNFWSVEKTVLNRTP